MAETIENLTLFAVELGRKGGKKTAERGPEYFAAIQAKRGTRGGGRPKGPLKAVYEGMLTIGTVQIPCAVLEDGTRVLSRAEFVRAIGRKGKAKGGRQYDDEFKTPVFLTAANLKQFIPQELDENSKPIPFKPLKGGGPAMGYRAELLPQVCSVFMDAGHENVLKQNQRHIYETCRMLFKGFATVGIVALVDEATGYQYFRARTALEEILEKFIATEFRKWAKTFPDDFYREMFRLRGWEFKEDTVKRTQLIGKLTLDLVYDRLAPGVRQRLEDVNPKNSKGHRKHKLFQRLTEDIGDPSLRAHLASVITLMKVSDDWQTFTKMLNRALPRFVPMPLFDKDEQKALPELTT